MSSGGLSPYWRRSFHRDPLTPYDFTSEPVDDAEQRSRSLAALRWMLALVLLCLMVTAPKWWPIVIGG